MTWLTLAEIDVRHVNAGLVGVAVNVAVALLVQLLFPRPAPSRTGDRPWVPHRTPAPGASAPGPHAAAATAPRNPDESPRG